MQETRVQFLGREDPLEEEMATLSGILAWRIPTESSLVGYSPWRCKESDTTERLRFFSSVGIPSGEIIRKSSKPFSH